jgi:hypothetical protein
MSSGQLNSIPPSSTVHAGAIEYCCKFSARVRRYVEELMHEEVVIRPLPDDSGSGSLWQTGVWCACNSLGSEESTRGRC